MKDNDFLSILKDSNVDVLEDIPEAGWIDSGSYIFNALLSGSIYKGFASNRVTAFAGMPSAGKSYLTLMCIKKWMEDTPNGQVLYFDTERALEKSMFAKRGIDLSRFHIVEPEHMQDFRTKSVNILDAYEKRKESERPPLFIALDSLSNLPSLKELNDAISGSEARDMTKQQVVRSIFRVITSKMGRLNVPMIYTNHVYSTMDIYSPVSISSPGSLYSASTVITLNKSKDKDGAEVVGNIIKATTYKSRYTKENQKVEMKLDYRTGLDRYYGLLPLAEKYEIIKKVSTRYEMPDGTKVFGKAINENPEKYYTKEILDRLDEAAKFEFGLGEGKAFVFDNDTENDNNITETEDHSET